MISSLVGIIASSGVGVAGGDYESISTVTVGAGGAGSVTFSSIPSTYQHLQIRVTALSGATYSEIQFNSDTGANYSYHQILGPGAGSASAAGGGGTSQIYALQMNNNTTYPTVGVIDVLDYANTNKNKTVRLLAGNDTNGGGELYFRSGGWFNTSAINSIKISALAGTALFNQYSSFALYGIKG